MIRNLFRLPDNSAHSPQSAWDGFADRIFRPARPFWKKKKEIILRLKKPYTFGVPRVNVLCGSFSRPQHWLRIKNCAYLFSIYACLCDRSNGKLLTKLQLPLEGGEVFLPLLKEHCFSQPAVYGPWSFPHCPECLAFKIVLKRNTSWA